MTAEEFEELMAEFRRRYRTMIPLGFPPLAKERSALMADVPPQTLVFEDALSEGQADVVRDIWRAAHSDGDDA